MLCVNSFFYWWTIRAENSLNNENISKNYKKLQKFFGGFLVIKIYVLNCQSICWRVVFMCLCLKGNLLG